MISRLADELASAASSAAGPAKPAPATTATMSAVAQSSAAEAAAASIVEPDGEAAESSDTDDTPTNEESDSAAGAASGGALDADDSAAAADDNEPDVICKEKDCSDLTTAFDSTNGQLVASAAANVGPSATSQSVSAPAYDYNSATATMDDIQQANRFNVALTRQVSVDRSAGSLSFDSSPTVVSNDIQLQQQQQLNDHTLADAQLFGASANVATGGNNLFTSAGSQSQSSSAASLLAAGPLDRCAFIVVVVIVQFVAMLRSQWIFIVPTSTTQ